ncbi:MAG: disulfide bond formation protein B [Gammaproteobacteria bacterium]|nr:disulfide bond formation protein B [Gammaproteobacteria bacterium]
MQSDLAVSGKTIVLLNIIEILTIAFVLTMAFVLQFVLHELPCPLCLLQRVGFLGVSVSLLLNLHFGIRSSHYSLALLFSLFTALVALRQIFLHIVPGTGTYGISIFHYQLYTWSFIVSILIIIYSSIILGCNVAHKTHTKHPARWHKLLAKYTFTVIVLLLLANTINVVLECGFVQCPDNPVEYKIRG